MIFISSVSDMSNIEITISDDHKTFRQSIIFNGSMTVAEVAKKFNI